MRHRREPDDDGPLPEPSQRARWLARAFVSAGDDTLTCGTRLLGSAARVRLPGVLARPLLRGWATLAGVDVARTPEPSWAEFRCFDEAFTRRVVDPVLPGAAPDAAVSPCDGILREWGRVLPSERGGPRRFGAASSLRSKWGRADLVELLGGDTELAAGFVGGSWVNVYLRPRDYHRVHAPLSGAVEIQARVPGRLLPLWDSVLALEPALFHVNERIVLRGRGSAGAWLLVLVAAFGVGGVEVLGEGHRQRGDEIAVFHMGSTALLLLTEGFEFVDALARGPVRCGQALARPSRP